MEKLITRERLGLPFDKHMVLYVGNLNEVKGVKYLIKAFLELSTHRSSFYLVIVGDGPERSRLEADIKKSGLAEFVRLVGEKPHDEVPLWMNCCDVFVLPSLKEGFGIVSLEALACGKPVVATKVGGTPEIVAYPWLGTLVEPSNPSQLAEAITTSLSKEWDPAALNKYACQYSWDQAAQMINKQYELIS